MASEKPLGEGLGQVMGMSRSENMARIRGRNTRPELRLRRMLWRLGVRYRVGLKTPVGRADLVLPAARVAVQGVPPYGKLLRIAHNARDAFSLAGIAVQDARNPCSP